MAFHVRVDTSLKGEERHTACVPNKVVVVVVVVVFFKEHSLVQCSALIDIRQNYTTAKLLKMLFINMSI